MPAAAVSPSSGWAEATDIDAVDLARRFEDAGVAAIVYTDIDRDGVLAGSEPRRDARVLPRPSSIPVIASGGLAGDRPTSPALSRARYRRLAGAIAGRALYDGRLDPAAALAMIAKAAGGGVMLKVRLIPCLDVKEGRVVKGVRFVDLADAGDPVESARAYDAAGADELCFLDITASHENRSTILDVVARTAEVCFMPVTVGGGVRTVEDVRALMLAGADKVSINTAAVRDRRIVAEASEKFGAQAIVVAIDAKKVSRDGDSGRWEIFTHGGRHPTGLDAVRICRRGDASRRRRDSA